MLRTGKKILKITGIVLGIIALLLIVFHFWFISHAKGMLEDAVAEKSKGKLKLTVRKLSYNYLNNRMIIRDAVFFNTDTATSNTASRFSVKELKVELKKLMPFLLHKELLIDSLHLQSPDIRVTRIRNNTDTLAKEDKEISIPYEMGKIYNSIQDALKMLEISHFKIDDGRFSLYNRTLPGSMPLEISNINFSIKNFRVDTSKVAVNEKVLFSDNVTLQSNNQRIAFPDGRHFLNFKKFNINLAEKIVAFDSCTIAAVKGTTRGSAFRIYFDKLQLTDIDFPTLYKSNIIKADSVFCLNPRFNLILESDEKKDKGKSSLQVEDIIKQLTGDLQMNFVVVQNADINITAIKNKVPTSFSFTQNNFEMQGLTINKKAETPIQVDQFAMAIRNYENFIRDSAYSVRFDSILFSNKQIILSNFFFQDNQKGRTSNRLDIPYFKLEGLSWDELVFEKRLKARQAILVNPSINYSIFPGQEFKNRQANLFRFLSTLNRNLELEKLSITNGKIRLSAGQKFNMQLDNANINLLSNTLLKAKNVSEIKNAVTSVSFSKGEISAGNYEASIDNASYDGGTGPYYFDSFWISSKDSSILINLKNAAISSLKQNKAENSIYANGIKWESADLKLRLPDEINSSIPPIIDLNNVNGEQTTLNLEAGGNKISAYIRNLLFSRLLKNHDNKIILSGLITYGDRFKLTTATTEATAETFNIEDDKKITLRELKFASDINGTASNIYFPFVTGKLSVQNLIDGNVNAADAEILNPEIRIRFKPKTINEPTSFNKKFPISLNKVRVIQPTLELINEKEKSPVSITWQSNSGSNNEVSIDKLVIDSLLNKRLEMEGINLNMTGFSILRNNKKLFNTGNGNIAGKFSRLNISRDDNEMLNWCTSITNAEVNNFRLDSLGKKNLSLFINRIKLANINISSENIISPQILYHDNTSAKLTNLTGTISSSSSIINWFNAAADISRKQISLDSLRYTPAMSRDSFLAEKRFQVDYLKAGSGAISAHGADFEKFVTDSSINISKLIINNAVLDDYKDKNLPLKPGIVKPLPAELIQRIPFRFKTDTVIVSNGYAKYEEEKNKQVLSVPVTRLNIMFLNLKNRQYQPADSLGIIATGFVFDSIWTSLRLKQSYSDSLGRFLLNGRLKAKDITFLNSITIPLAAVKIRSGNIDTITMSVAGHEYVALGKMKMLYDNLKIDVLKEETGKRKKFATMLANTFLINTKNKGDIGEVFYIRQRDKSAINYLVRITLSGISGSIGLKSYKKMIRKYRKEIQRGEILFLETD